MPGQQQRTVVLHGYVDGASTERVAEALAGLERGDSLLVDLQRATGLDAVTLAALVRMLLERSEPPTVRILGLSRRDCQLLGYLGYDLERLGLSGWSEPAARALA